MCEITVKVSCSDCKSDKVKKNGLKPNGKQDFLCKPCGKQFQYFYAYRGADPWEQAADSADVRAGQRGSRHSRCVEGECFHCIAQLGNLNAADLATFKAKFKVLL
jgi:hypothetical protein